MMFLALYWGSLLILMLFFNFLMIFCNEAFATHMLFNGQMDGL